MVSNHIGSKPIWFETSGSKPMRLFEPNVVITDRNQCGHCGYYGSKPMWPARIPFRAIFVIIHGYLSQQRFHFCFETFHSRLLSLWAALIKGISPNRQKPLPAHDRSKPESRESELHPSCPRSWHGINQASTTRDFD